MPEGLGCGAGVDEQSSALGQTLPIHNSFDVHHGPASPAVPSCDRGCATICEAYLVGHRTCPAARVPERALRTPTATARTFWCASCAARSEPWWLAGAPSLREVPGAR